MTRHEEAVFEAKAERHFRSHRELPRGRDFRWNTFRFNNEADLAHYRHNFDRIFPSAPGAGI